MPAAARRARAAIAFNALPRSSPRIAAFIGPVAPLQRAVSGRSRALSSARRNARLRRGRPADRRQWQRRTGTVSAPEVRACCSAPAA